MDDLLRLMGPRLLDVPRTACLLASEYWGGRRVKITEEYAYDDLTPVNVRGWGVYVQAGVGPYRDPRVLRGPFALWPHPPYAAGTLPSALDPTGVSWVGFWCLVDPCLVGGPFSRDSVRYSEFRESVQANLPHLATDPACIYDPRDPPWERIRDELRLLREELGVTG